MKLANTAMGLTLWLTLAGIPAGAQSTSSSQSVPSGGSLGDYARQVRKTNDSSSKPKVYDNDNLPKNDKLSIVGTVGPEKAPESLTEQADTNAETKPGADTKSAAASPAKTDTKGAEDQADKDAAAKQWADKIATQKDQVDLMTRELDVLQREYQLRAAAMYADAGNRLRNSADWDKQDAQYKQQIADKQKALDEAKQKLSDIQDEATKAGAPSSVTEQ